MEGLFGFDNLNKLLDEMGHYLVGACGRQNVFRTSFDTFSIIAVGTQGKYGISVRLRECQNGNMVKKILT